MSAQDPNSTRNNPPPTGTITFLFTDIEGSTQLLQRLGDAYAGLLADQRQILRAVFQKYDGVEIDTQGDSFFIAFPRAEQAVKAAAEAQRSLASHPWPKGELLRVRMALHTGEPTIGPTGYVGLDVHRAARICSSGHGGQVLLSAATRTLVEQALPEGLALRSLGEHRLKDLLCPEHIYQLIIAGLPSEFPALRSLSLLPNNLPLQLTSFIGRQHEIDQLKCLLGKERLVTLVGAGGSGKTRLALQAAAEMLEAFQDGVWFVDLAPLSGSAFLDQALASVLNLHEAAGRSLQEVLVAHLHSRLVLLILDNCEHLVAACARLSESLLQDCPQLHILVTSRQALGLASEHLLPVPTLSLPQAELLPGKLAQDLPVIQQSEAVRLFVERAGAVHPGFALTPANALVVAQVCQRLDGIPLAIELAAARTRMMSVGEILSRLDDRFHLLTGGSRTALPRQQTLRALVEWSHDLLSVPEQHLFQRLSVFAGGWTLEAAEAVCADGGISSREIMDLLTHLVDKSLVLAGSAADSTRFHMLETIHQFARELSQASAGKEDLHRRHLDHYFRLVKASQKGLNGLDPTVWLKLLDAEKGNLYAALTWAMQAGEAYTGIALEMSGGLWMWWLARGMLSEGRHWLEKALEKGQNRTAPRAMALASMGCMAWQQADFPQASRCLDESVSILRALEIPDLPGLAHAIHMLGHTALDRGDFPAASTAFLESLDLYRELNDQYYLGTLISDLGMVAYHQGEYASARDYQEQSLAIFQKYGNSEVTSQTLHRLGELARLEGNYDRAGECYEACLQTYREIGMKLEIASNLHKLGYVAQHHGDHQKARSLFNAALLIQRETGHKQGIAECLAGLAGLAAVTNQPARALRLFAAAQALLDACQAPLAPADLAEWKRDQAIAFRHLDAAASVQAQAEGQAMDLEQAIEFALREDG